MDMEKLVALCRRRGFIFQSSEIYGGINGFWDYGPLGVELKNNIKQAWWHDMVRNPPLGPDGQEISMVGVDCSIIMNPKVWQASGHVDTFADPLVDCKTCRKRYRAGGLGGVASAGGPAIISPLRRMATGLGGGSSTADSPPAWARRMKRAQTVSQGVSAATHAVRSGDSAGGGSSVDLSDGGH